MKQTLIDTQLFKPFSTTLTEGKVSKRGNPVVEGILATCEIKNGNGRYYPKELWEREMEKYQELIDQHRALGELDHPESSVVNLKNVSHNILDAKFNGDDVIGKVEILPTPSGNILKALLDNGIMVGVSSRGMGSLEQNGEIMEVQDDFELLCWDFVSTPSNPGSFMQPISIDNKGTVNINENQIITSNPYLKANLIITEILCANGNCPIV